MSGHVNAEALALCREGLLGKRRTARTEAHVSRCARCAEVDAGLGALPALLALSSVPPMPAELTARLSGVIAALMDGGEAGKPSEMEVVGIVANVREHIVGRSGDPHVYMPFGQEYQSDMHVHL